MYCLSLTYEIIPCPRVFIQNNKQFHTCSTINFVTKENFYVEFLKFNKMNTLDILSAT